MRDLIRVLVVAVVLIVDAVTAVREITATIRTIWCPAVVPAPSIDPLLGLYDQLMSLSARELRAIAPAGLRRATKHPIAIALIA